MAAQDAQPRLLESLRDIDAAWIEQVLRQAGHDAHVTDFSIEPIGAGNVSDTARLVLRAEGDAPASLVAKFRPAADGAHAHGVASGAYVREAGGYGLLRDVADGCRIPRLLWLNGTADNINLVMEDLSSSTRPGDQVAGCSIVDAAAVVTQLARLHRGFWPMREAQAPAWAIRMPEAGDYWTPVIERAVPLIEQRFAGILADQHIALVAEAAGASRAWHNLRHPAMTITHGDPRVDNVLFRDGADGPVAILIDWQVTGVRNAMHDVGYFLSGSIAVEDRRRAEKDLLRLYADEFGTAKGYRLDAIVTDYRIQLVSGLMTSAAAVAVLPDVAPVNRLIAALLERNCAAVEDWESIAAIHRLA